MIYIGAGILGLIIFMFVFGLNFLVNVGIWVGNTLSGNRSDQQIRREDFFGTLFVDDLPPATNSAEIFVSGTSSDFDRIAFYVNDKKSDEIELMNNDSFSEKVSGLKEGKNTLFVRAYNDTLKEQKESDPVTVIYKKGKPKLEITEPANDATVKKDEITVKGTTEEGNELEVDGSPVVVTAQGSFQESVRLKEGENSIVILARDIAGNEETVELKVKYEKEE
jgi:hypothetical protein